MPRFSITPPGGQPVIVEAPSQYEAMGQVLGASTPDVSTLGSFGRGVASTVPLGEQAYAGISSLAQNEPYAQERKELDNEIASDKENNPGARFAGQAVGVAAPIALTGGLAAPESLGEAALQGAGVGGAFGAGNAIDTLAGGGSGTQALADVGMGAGLGAAGGMTAKALGELLGKLAASKGTLEHEATIGEGVPVPHPEGAPIEVNPNAATATVNAQGTPGVVGNPTGAMNSVAQAGSDIPASPSIPGSASFTPVRPPVTPETNTGYSETTSSPAPSDSELRARQAVQLWSGTPRQVRKLPGKNLSQTINHMVDVAKANSTPQDDLFALTDRYGDRLKKYVALQEQAGKTIGDTIEKANVAPMPVSPIVEKLKTSLNFPTPDQEAQMTALANKVQQKWASPDGTISFPRLQQLKTALGAEGFGGKGDPVLQHAYHIVGNAQDAELEKLSQQINKPAFDKAKDAYQMTSRVVPMLRMGAAKSLTGRPSLTELLSGHPLEALGKLGGERLQGIKNAIGFKVADALDSTNVGNLVPIGGAAASAPVTKAATDIPLQHPALAPWRKYFAPDPTQGTQMADGGVVAPQEHLGPAEIQKHNAVTDFTLSQRDPAYAEAKQKALDDAAKTPETPEMPTNMAEGGLVSDMENKIAAAKPVEGFGSTLQGFQDMVSHPVAHDEPVKPAYSAKAGSFNSQMADQLKAYLLDTKDDKDR